MELAAVTGVTRWKHCFDPSQTFPLANGRQSDMKSGRVIKIAAVVLVSAAGLLLLAFGVMYLWVMIPCFTRQACL